MMLSPWPLTRITAKQPVHMRAWHACYVLVADLRTRQLAACKFLFQLQLDVQVFTTTPLACTAFMRALAA